MKNLGAGIKVGVTFLVVAVAAYWSFTMLAKGGCAGEPDAMIVHAYFKDATLLVKKSRVQIAGLNVGHIVSRSLHVRPPREELVKQKRFARITVALNKGMVVYSNARIAKRSASLLGEFYLEIDPGTHRWIDAQGKVHIDERLKDGAEIEFVGEAATAPDLVQSINDILPIVKSLATEIRSFVTGPLTKVGQNLNAGVVENRQAVRDILSNVERITKDIRAVTAGTGQDVQRVVDDIKHITKTVRGLVDTGDKEVRGYGDRVKTGLDKLNVAIDKLDSTLGNTSAITENIKQGKGSVGRLLTDDSLIKNVEGIVEDAGELVQSITGLQTMVGLRSEYNFQAGSIKTYVTVELRPRPDKYYLIELIDDPRGRRQVKTTVTRSDDPTEPVLKKEDTVEVTDAFRLTFQFAKRIAFATFRFGIKESTGGIGLDLHFWRDQIRIEADLFDFQANVFPRFKALAAWEFFRRLYIVGGIDDAFNERPKDGTGGGRDFFVGGQIRFNDEDLKQLLLFGGGALSGGVGGGG